MTPEAVIEPKRVSVVIVLFNRIETLRESLTALGDDHQVIVVDNGSTDGSHALDEEFPNIRFIRLPKNFGLTRAMNIGLRAAEGTCLLLLHDDAIVSGETVTQLADYLEERQEAGAVAPLLVNRNGQPAPQIRELPSPGHPDPPFRPAEATSDSNVPSALGAALMFRTFFLRALGQIDERYGVYGGTVELCMQVRRANRRIVIRRNLPAIHEGLPSPMKKSALQGDRTAGTAAYLGKHHGLLAGLLYRLQYALLGLFTFRFKMLTGALLGAKIDGTS